jgi:hypothetical protein
MNPTLVAHRLREQLDRFSGIFYPRFSKPQGRFLRQMIYGIEAAQDVKLSAITRELGESIALKKTSERLSHHLQAEGMDQTINEAIAQYAASDVKPDTLIVVDPTDVRKAYARRRPFLATVRDGSSGTLVPGYWGCIAVACEAGTSAWFVVEAYLTRWRVEETIRFIKQSYHLEDLRVLDYQRLRNLMALVLAAVVFSAVWLGRSLKLSILTAHVTNVSKRFFGVPDFHYYALADGIARLLSRLGSYAPCATPNTPPPDHQLTFLFSSA